MGVWVLNPPVRANHRSSNVITALLTYIQVVDVPNSMTVLTDLLPISLTMAQRKLTGGFWVLCALGYGGWMFRDRTGL